VCLAQNQPHRVNQTVDCFCSQSQRQRHSSVLRPSDQPSLADLVALAQKRLRAHTDTDSGLVAMRWPVTASCRCIDASPDYSAPCSRRDAAQLLASTSRPSPAVDQSTAISVSDRVVVCPCRRESRCCRRCAQLLIHCQPVAVRTFSEAAAPRHASLRQRRGRATSTNVVAC